MIDAHRHEIDQFSSALHPADDVAFDACSYCDLLIDWGNSGSPEVRGHAAALHGLGVVRA
jgi:hypothetical protein